MSTNERKKPSRKKNKLLNAVDMNKGRHLAPFFIGAPGMARCAKRNQLGCGGHADDLEVKVLYTPGKGKC